MILKEIENMPSYPSKVIESKSGKGKVLVSTKDLPAGSAVERFEGPVIKYAEVPQDMIRYVIFVGEKEGDDRWVVSRTGAIFANHSCDPNCRIDENLNIVTVRDVKKGDELTYSYDALEDCEKESDFLWDKKWNFECKCGSKNCRKKINKYISKNIHQA